jgi:hypothetical protein
MYIWYISHVYGKIHMYHIFYMKCTVLLVFSCVFTVFSLQKHELLVHFTWIYQNTHVPYILHEMHCFASVVMCFHCVSLQKHVLLVHITYIYWNTHVLYILHEVHCFASVFMSFHYVFTAEKCTFGTFHLYTKIHMYHIFYMKCTVLLVFSFVFTVFSLQKHVLLVHFTWIYQNTHVPYILHEMHSFASVFTVFSLQKHMLLVHFTCIPKYRCTIYS